jgi:hypothetical protein
VAVLGWAAVAPRHRHLLFWWHLGQAKQIVTELCQKDLANLIDGLVLVLSRDDWLRSGLVDLPDEIAHEFEESTNKLALDIAQIPEIFKL